MRALWSDRPNCSHNVSQKVKRIRRVSDYRGSGMVGCGVTFFFAGSEFSISEPEMHGRKHSFCRIAEIFDFSTLTKRLPNPNRSQWRAFRPDENKTEVLTLKPSFTECLALYQ